MDRVQQWFLAHCDGDWEHGYGIEIEILDNPGWRVKIQLEGTELSDRTFVGSEIESSDLDWLRCWLEDQAFHIACGPLNLTEGLEAFLGWAETRPL